MILNFEGRRLREARRFKKLTIKELAESVGVSKQMISKYEKNEARPSTEVYHKLVLRLGFPLKFYQQKDQFDIIDKGTFYRSRYTSTQTEKKPSEILKKYFAIICDFFEEYVEFPELPRTELSNNPVTAAKQLRNYWGLGEVPIKNMLMLLEEHGFHIASVSSTTEKVDAFSSFIEVNGNNQYCVLIDKDNNSFYRQQFSLAHELGHWILHARSVDPTELSPKDHKDIESDANLFASNFLMPKESFSSDLKQLDMNLDSFLSLKEKWKVSVSSMIFRAKDLEIISADEYLRLQKRISARGWRKKEPFDEIVDVPKPFALQQAYNLLLEANIFQNQTIQDLIENKYGICIPNYLIAELIGLKKEELEANNKKVVSFRRS